MAMVVAASRLLAAFSVSACLSVCLCLTSAYFATVMGCLLYPIPTADGDEYCGVLNEAENCVLSNAGWVCA